MQAFRKNWFLIFIPIVLIPLYLVTFFGMPTIHLPFLYFNQTASLPRGYYLAIPTLSIRNGDIVAYEEKDILDYAKGMGWLSEDTDTSRMDMTKHAALPGTHYRIGEDGNFYVNGSFVGKIYVANQLGQPFPHQKPGDYVVPEGMFLPYTYAPLSFDGRYTGLVKLQKIRHRVIPLFTF